MIYKLFCCFKDHPTSLTEEEILNPFLVLKPLADREEYSRIKNGLWLLITNLYKQYQWMEQTEPLVLYDIYTELVRILDAAWVLQRIRPDYKVKGIINEPVFDRLCKDAFQKGNEKPSVPANFGNYQTLHNLFRDKMLWKSKLNLYTWCRYGLTPLAIPGPDQEIETDNLISDYRVPASLIDLLHAICRDDRESSLTSAEQKQLDRYKFYASGYDHTTTLSRDEMEDPGSVFQTFFESVDYEDFPRLLDLWNTNLIFGNIWEKYNDPGDALLIKQLTEYLMESAWIVLEDLDYEERGPASKPGYNFDKPSKEKFPDLTDEEYRLPYTVFQKFFDFKPLYQWKAHLEQWLRESLRNTENDHFFRENLLPCDYLKKLVEAGYLYHCYPG